MLQVETAHSNLQVSDIKMFHAKAVAQWRGLMAAAQEKLGGVQTGLGFIGSPGWVATGALVLGALESALSSASAKAGVKLLGEANGLLDEIHHRGVFIPVADITGIDRPQPETWRAKQGGIEFILLGGDFIRVRDAARGELDLRWSAVSIACVARRA